MSKKPSDVCRWELVRAGVMYWGSACGVQWAPTGFGNPDHPHQFGMTYCYRCGKKLRVEPK
jgi:hypothetical protein